MKNLNLTDILDKLVEDYNQYSESIAQIYEDGEEGWIDWDERQRNRGNLERIEKYLKELSGAIGVKLRWGYDYRASGLQYITVGKVD